ncbi:MAG: hypothetical protein U5K74_07390 [Gemmatimonadaceae bacterium]|nr:hypothetical protein [Gemmatimonadaceae bacterium]
MRHALTAVGLLAVVVACASQGMPPGGPTVSSFPRVIATRPDTNALNVKPGKVLIRYDDVIGEQAERRRTLTQRADLAMGRRTARGMAPHRHDGATEG